MSDYLIITGLSGAGRSTAADTLEDLGWFVIDNLPPSLIGKVTELVTARERGPAGGAGEWAQRAEYVSELTTALEQLCAGPPNQVRCCSSTRPTTSSCAASRGPGAAIR